MTEAEMIEYLRNVIKEKENKEKKFLKISILVIAIIYFIIMVI